MHLKLILQMERLTDQLAEWLFRSRISTNQETLKTRAKTLNHHPCRWFHGHYPQKKPKEEMDRNSFSWQFLGEAWFDHWCLLHSWITTTQKKKKKTKKKQKRKNLTEDGWKCQKEEIPEREEEGEEEEGRAYWRWAREWLIICWQCCGVVP